MTIVRTIDSIVDWLNANVCPEILMKVPPTDRNPDDVTYDYKLMHPHTFPLFVPTRDKLPPNVVCNTPSICVQLTNGNDDPDNREINISLGFGAWNPGIHPGDWIIPYGYNPEEGETDTFISIAEGWRDLWNLVDITAAKLQSTTYIGDVEVMQYEGMEFGQYREEQSIASYYPFWYAYLNFKVRSSLRRNNAAIEEML